MSTATKKPQTSQNLTSEQLRVLAEHAEGKETDQRKQNRRKQVKRAAGVPDKRWATEKNTKVAEKHDAAARREQDKRAKQQQPTFNVEFRETQRKGMVRARNRRRRLPWYPAFATVAYGMLVQGVAWLFGTAGVPLLATAAVLAGVPVVVAACAATRMERRHYRQVQQADQQGTSEPEPAHRRWFLEIGLAGAVSAAVTFWVGTTGMSWLVVLAVLLSMITLGMRWWKANPIGPGVAPLEPPKPAPAPEPAPETAPDPYALAWTRNLDGYGQLTNRVETDNTLHYDVDLPPGKTTWPTVAKNVLTIAGALGLDPQQVIPEPPRKQGDFRPANKARLTIILRDVAAGQRYWTNPNVQMAPDGTAAVLTNLARFRDGQGEAKATMWNSDGMVPTTIYGSSGSGKSAAVNAITVSAMSTGLMNSVYVDFKGNSSGMLRNRARIVVVGQNAVHDVRQLMELLRSVRIKNDPREKQFPSADRPGWFAFIEEIAKGIKGDPKFALEMENMATTVRSLGIWLVATAHDQHHSSWGGTNTRSAFSKQAFVFYMNTDSNDMINGLTYDSSQLPTYDEEDAAPGQEAQPIPGFGVGVNTFRPNVPARWDWLPGDDDPVEQEPPYRATAGWDTFADEPGIAQDEYDALVDALGQPNPDGRWIIGIGGTHQFRTRDGEGGGTASGGARPVRTTGFGTPQSDNPVEGLPDSQRKVHQVIAGGTTKAGDIEAALDMLGRSTVQSALSSLVGANLIHRASKGEYALGPEPESHQ